MASPSRTQEREEERRLNVRTLAIASAASATAAAVTSQLWIAGTWLAAAVTPVIVALVSELLHRPTEQIARVVTSDRPALLAEAAGAAPPPPPDADPLPERAPAEPGSEPQPRPVTGPVRVYRQPASPQRRRLALGVVAATAAIAFVVAALLITVPELIFGQSLGKGDGRTSLFGGNRARDSEPATGQPTTPADRTPDQQTTPDQERPEQGTQPDEPPPEDPLEETAPEGQPPTDTETTAPPPTTTTPP